MLGIGWIVAIVLVVILFIVLVAFLISQSTVQSARNLVCDNVGKINRILTEQAWFIRTLIMDTISKKSCIDYLVDLLIDSDVQIGTIFDQLTGGQQGATLATALSNRNRLVKGLIDDAVLGADTQRDLVLLREEETRITNIIVGQIPDIDGNLIMDQFRLIDENILTQVSSEQSGVCNLSIGSFTTMKDAYLEIGDILLKA